jgi:hypothetical protein
MISQASSLLGSLRANWISVWLFLILNAADCSLSHTLVARGMRELNPIWQVVPIWCKLVLAATFLLFLAGRKDMLLALNVVLGLVVAWNFALLWA